MNFMKLNFSFKQSMGYIGLYIKLLLLQDQSSAGSGMKPLIKDQRYDNMLLGQSCRTSREAVT
jgi:hypothetical protein